MAGEKRHASAAVDADAESDLDAREASSARMQALLDSAHRAGFFAVMTQLERLTANAVRVGGEGPVEGEVIRFRHDANLAFSAGDITRARVRTLKTDMPGRTRDVYELTTTFLGLSGSVGPLPLHIADELAQDTPQAKVQRAFLDVFHHRLVSLMYRAWVRYQVSREHESSETDAWSLRLLSLLGVDRYAQLEAQRIPSHVLLRCAAMLAGRARTAHTLTVVLTEALADVLDGATVSIEQRLGGMSELDPNARMRLGRANNVLGRSTTLGSHVLERGGRFLLKVGPLPANFSEHFNPGGDKLALINDVVRFVLREPLSYEVELTWRSEGHDAFTLSSVTPARLGRSSWLGGAGPNALRASRVVAVQH